ncbi:hypothetical protein TSUD_398920, partial [Trifolium subterraneum]
MAPKKGRFSNLGNSSRGGNTQNYEKFLSPENQGRYNEIVGVRFNGERGFDTEKLTQYPMILEELRR